MKNRIDFGQKNSSEHKQLWQVHHIQCAEMSPKYLTETSRTSTKPWDLQCVHKITVALVLNYIERRYVAEILAIIEEGEQPFSLTPDHVIEWLAPRLKHMEITIILEDRPHLSEYNQIKYAAYLTGLGVTVCSQVLGSSQVWMRKSTGFSLR